MIIDLEPSSNLMKVLVFLILINDNRLVETIFCQRVAQRMSFCLHSLSHLSIQLKWLVALDESLILFPEVLPRNILLNKK